MRFLSSANKEKHRELQAGETIMKGIKFYSFENKEEMCGMLHSSYHNDWQHLVLQNTLINMCHFQLHAERYW